jgi:hypothetical protein
MLGLGAAYIEQPIQFKATTLDGGIVTCLATIVALWQNKTIVNMRTESLRHYGRPLVDGEVALLLPLEEP